ncbi:MAG: hypothetical protein KQH83_11110 [Actinobacteria bacterium]|nr:hypothetical protein [Actinomycetota bacterium]
MADIGTARPAPGAPDAVPGLLDAHPGRVLALEGPPGSGLTRLGLAVLAAHPGTVAAVDVRGWLSPLAAWEAGIPPERLVIVRCPDRGLWAQVTAALLEGLGAVYAEVPAGASDALLRRLGALARARRAALLLRPVRGGIPAGLAHLRLRGEGVAWEGAGEGHGRLGRRLLTLRAAGKGAGGMERHIEVEDDGTDAVRVVPGLAAAPSRRAAG